MMPKGPFWTWRRVSSGLVFIGVQLAAAGFLLDVPDEVAGKVLAPAILGLLCVWFSDALGGFTGRYSFSPGISRETRAVVIYWFGWFLLVLPAVLVLALEWTTA